MEVQKNQVSMIGKDKAADCCINGICGWLSPDGEFIDAAYGKHAEVALNIENERKIKPIHDEYLSHRVVHGERLFELSGYIKFTCRQVGNRVVDAYVFFPQQFGYEGEITDRQLEWISENFYRLFTYQKKYVKQYLYYNFGFSI